MQRRIIKFAQSLTGQHDDVQIDQTASVKPKRLTGNALDTIAVYGTTDTFLGNDQAQPALLQTVGSGQQQKTGSRGLAGGSIEYCLELCRRQ